MNKKFLSVLMLIFLAMPMLALAANPCSGGTAGDVTTLPRCINQIYVWSLGVGALLALFMTIIGGYYYMTASGNAEQSAKGVEMIWGSIIGLALLFGAYLLLRTINPDLVNFQLTKGLCYDSAGQLVSGSAATDKTSCEGTPGYKWYSVFDNSTPAPTPAPTVPRAPATTTP